MTTAPPPKKSDLGVRTASAVVMIAVAGSALWLGGYWWTAFVAAVALGVLWEWWGLVWAFAPGLTASAGWLVLGLIYIGGAAYMLVFLRIPEFGPAPILLLVSTVIAVDVGAYFAGRTIGGPKIAPSISPSKTWAGLAGGMVAATLIVWIGAHEVGKLNPWLIVGAPLVAIVAQIGDFFESWLKRRAGVKDSGALIPGHGGLFDRVDGLIAVAFALELAGLVIPLFFNPNI